MIRVRVNKANTISNKNSDTLINWYRWPQVPEVGELVNLEGEPYYVIERGWASTNGYSDGRNENPDQTNLYCYLRVRA